MLMVFCIKKSIQSMGVKIEKKVIVGVNTFIDINIWDITLV